ncbi:MAG: SGNH/GDSL hydrolase family protein [Candidatus Aenigmarchaeota archaeon]|nr:SGNH/GDSL hydrolase family protein [Candidatus Aenigmarchaeota archaeon]
MEYSENLLGNVLKPSFEQKFDGFGVKLPVTTIKINSDGFRDKEYSIEKPNDTFRIVVLGDSITFGWGVNNDEIYTEILEEKLNSLNNGINYEVLNFGVPGYNTENEVEMFKVKGTKYNPDMIIIGFNQGDEMNLIKIREEIEKNKAKNPYLNNKSDEDIFRNKLLQKQLIEVHEKAYKKIIESAVNQSTSSKLKTINEYLYELKKIKIDTKVIIVTFDAGEDIEIIKNAANENNFYFIDMSEFLSNYKLGELTLHKIDGHPSPFQHKLVGNNLFNYLTKNNLIPTNIITPSENH